MAAVRTAHCCSQRPRHWLTVAGCARLRSALRSACCTHAAAMQRAPCQLLELRARTTGTAGQGAWALAFRTRRRAAAVHPRHGTAPHRTAPLRAGGRCCLACGLYAHVGGLGCLPLLTAAAPGAGAGPGLERRACWCGAAWIAGVLRRACFSPLGPGRGPGIAERSDTVLDRGHQASQRAERRSEWGRRLYCQHGQGPSRRVFG